MNENYDDIVNTDDDYYKIENEYDYEYEDISANIFQTCIQPTIIQLIQYVSPIIIASILIRLLLVKNVTSKFTINLLNILVSSSLLIYYYKLSIFIYFIAYILKIYVLLINLTSKQHTNNTRHTLLIIVIFISSIHMFTGRFILFDQTEWNSIKGIEMILIMKIISYVYDLNNINLFNLISYSLSINTCLFGPWISYKEHQQQQQPHELNYLNLIKNTIISICCLIISSCCFNLIDVYLNSSYLVVRIYFEALSFRLSNYFIAYLSQLLCNLNGLSSKQVTRPNLIELPYSLLDVVTAWNLPIHYWLKQYVFKPVKETNKQTLTSTILPVAATYFVSSMLHAFDENISLILFSLGFYTYVEFGLRKNLSRLFQCCIQTTRPCYSLTNADGVCLHRFKRDHFISKFINFIFLLINLWHLAYLGQIFFHANNSTTTTTTRWFYLAQLKWSSTYYSSHLIALFSFILFKITNYF
jgi:porcupine-like protein